MPNAVIMDSADNVVTVTSEIPCGASVTWCSGQGELGQMAITPIPRYHKMSIHPIRKGEEILKYGEHIGLATADIRAGEHVHTHNLSSTGG